MKLLIAPGATLIKQYSSVSKYRTDFVNMRLIHPVKLSKIYLRLPRVPGPQLLTFLTNCIFVEFLRSIMNSSVIACLLMNQFVFYRKRTSARYSIKKLEYTLNSNQPCNANQEISSLVNSVSIP